MRRWIILGRLLLCTVLACVSGLSQEPYEARAARLQPGDIPPLIEKARNGDLGSQILLWLAYAGGHGVPKDVQRGVPWLRKAAEQGNIECEWVLSKTCTTPAKVDCRLIRLSPSTGRSRLHSAATWSRSTTSVVLTVWAPE